MRNAMTNLIIAIKNEVPRGMVECPECGHNAEQMATFDENISRILCFKCGHIEEINLNTLFEGSGVDSFHKTAVPVFAIEELDEVEEIFSMVG